MADLTKVADVTDAPVEETPQVVHIGVLGGKRSLIDYTPGMTVHQAFEASNQAPSPDAFITVNGVPATMDTVLEANSALMFTVAPANG